MNLKQLMTARAMLFTGLVSMFTASASAQVTHQVIVGFGGFTVFSPRSVTIDVGDTIMWIWDSDGHNVGSGLPGAPTSAFLSGPPDVAGTIFSVTFDQAFLDANPVLDDFYDYHCHPHGGFGMIGSIAVVPAPGTAVVGLAGLLAIGSRRRR